MYTPKFNVLFYQLARLASSLRSGGRQVLHPEPNREEGDRQGPGRQEGPRVERLLQGQNRLKRYRYLRLQLVHQIHIG